MPPREVTSVPNQRAKKKKKKTVKYFKSIEHVHQALIGKENLGLQGEVLSEQTKRRRRRSHISDEGWSEGACTTETYVEEGYHSSSPPKRSRQRE
jgi:hypothetical protein